MGEPAAAVDAGIEVAEEDRLRADLYGLLAVLLSRPPSSELIKVCAGLAGDSGPLGAGINALARVARTASEKSVEREFHNLFIGLGRGELLPYASFYLTGFLHERPLAKLRGDMAAFGIARADDVKEPEDNIASLMDIMSGLITGRYGTVAPDLQRTFFTTHVEPWAGHFFSDLEGARASVFYAPVGTVGREFMEVEQTAFRMEA